MQQNKRAEELDFWKLIFAFLIVVLHSSYLPGVKDAYCQGGSIGVEFFFIVSGFLMAKSAEKVRGSGRAVVLADETFSFLKRKIQAFYPYVLFGFFVSVVAKTFFWGGNTLSLIKNFGKGLSEILFLNWSGVGGDCFNAPTWYLSAMLLSMAVLYPMILKYGKTVSRVFCPLAAAFLLGYLFQKYGQFRTPSAWDGLFKKGMIRAFAEISFGVFCAEICADMKKCQFTVFSRLLMTVLEYGSLIGIILYSNRWNCWDMDTPSVLLIGASIVIAGGNFSLLSGFWNKLPFMPKLGKFSLMLYLNHIYWVWIFALLKLNMSYPKMLVLYLGCAVASSLCCWLVVDGIKWLCGKRGLNLRAAFVKEQ